MFLLLPLLAFVFIPGSIAKSHGFRHKTKLPAKFSLDVQLKMHTRHNDEAPCNILNTILRHDSRRAARSLLGIDHVSRRTTLRKSPSTQATDSSLPPTTDVENSVWSYLVKVKVGSNNQTFNLVVDTGSSNTWVGMNQEFAWSESTQYTGSRFHVTYGSGAVSGEEIIENVQLGESEALSVQQSIGVATDTPGFNEEFNEGVDGILGVGPTVLTLNTQTLASTEVPTIMDTLYEGRKIPSNILGISFAPSNKKRSVNGRLTFGGVDSSLYKGQLAYIPRTTTRPATFFWGVNATVTCGGSVIIPNSAGIMDTGTTLIIVSEAAQIKYLNAIPGAILDTDGPDPTGLVKIPVDLVSTMPPLVVDFGTFKATLTAEQQLFPKELSDQIGGEENFRYSYVNTGGLQNDFGLDFIMGQKFFEHFYTSYDSTNNAIGIAPSAIRQGS